jgi:DNA-binding transcriptional MocR family regulator
MPDEAKARLVTLCETADAALIEDDTLSALSEQATPLKAVKSWDRNGRVIHCASLRKILAPGLRIGWVAGGRWHARIQMIKHAQSRANDGLAQRAIADVIGSPGYERHLARLRQRLGVQRRETAAAIASFFPSGTRLSIPAGGMTLWIELPEGCSSQAVFEQVLPLGVRFVPGSMFSNSNRFDHFLRISCGATFDRATEDALRTIGHAAAQAR